MNKKIKIFISCFIALFVGLISFIGVKTVNAYELDSNNNIVSANLCPNTNLFVGYINGNGVLTDTSQSDTLNTDYIYLTSGTYTISSDLPRVQINWFSAPNSSSLVGGFAWNTFTFTLDNNYYVRIGINNQSETYYNSNTYLPSSFNLMLNNGSVALPYEPYGTWYNESYLRASRMGIFSELMYLQPYINNQGYDEYSINDLFNNGLITENNSIKLISISDDINTSYEPIGFDFYFNNYIPKSQFKLAFSSVADINYFKIGGYNSANPNVEYVYTLSINELPTYFDLTDYETNNIDYIDYFSVFFNNAEQVVNVNGNIEYYNGYNAGLDVANRWQNMYNELESSYNSLKEQYNDLLRQYNNYINGNVTLDTLIWNIATTPFETFKTIWDVDVLGVNLGSLCVGLMFVGIALYIWRKFI